MPPEFFEDGRKRKHALEDLFNASGWDILTAIEHGHRARTDVKGKLAEFFLDPHLSDLQSRKVISTYVWSDKTGEPDFIVEVGGSILRVECKNVRSGSAVYRNAYKVELQKTRNQLSGEKKLRGYRVSDFHILAACLFNQTQKWEFIFVSTTELKRRPKSPDYLAVMQKVP